MDLAWVSLIALLVVIILSCTNRVHPGFLALALAWFIGVYVSSYFDVQLDLKRDVLANFPVDLFLTLTGVSLLFTQAHLNGTLDRLAHVGIALCRGNAGLIPWMFFTLAATLAIVGAGNIAAAALVAPTAMAVATRARIPGVLMSILVAHGALAGALSPISPTGLIAEKQMSSARVDLPGHGWEMFAHNLVANIAVAVLAFAIFGGLKLFARRYDPAAAADSLAADARFERRHWATLALISMLMAGVLAWKVDVGMGAFACAVVLALTGLADDSAAVKQMPWSVILMVCGVNVLTGLLGNDKVGGTALFADLIVHVSSPKTAAGVLGFVAAVISVYSSTSGVVLPAFLPMVRDVSERLPGTDPVALALAVVVAGHLVDSSPLSTIGALCVSSAGPNEDRRGLFVKTLLWGLAMSVVGGVWCLVLYGLCW